jgi:hypothetical protein
MADLTQTTIGGGSAILVAENRKSAYDVTAVDYYGNKPLTIFEVACGSAVNGQADSGEAIEVIMRTIQKYATVVIRGALYNTNQNFCVAIETPNDTQDWDGAGAETLVEQIEDELVALGDLSSATPNQIDYASVTCTVKTVFQVTT